MRGIWRCWMGALGLAVAAQAHQFWIEPSTFEPAAGEIVRVSVFVGERFAGEPFARDGTHIKRFELVTDAGAAKVIGRSGATPAGMARMSNDGLGILVYESNPRVSELPANRFETYLREEGLESVIAQRAARGESQAAGTEAYHRCAKSIVKCGSGSGSGFDREVGLPLEIIPLNNPLAWSSEKPLRVRVLFEGKPLAGARLVAMNRSAPQQHVELRTSDAGEAEIVINRDGEWLLTTIHMIRAASAADTDWVSYWSSLTFDSREAKTP